MCFESTRPTRLIGLCVVLLMVTVLDADEPRKDATSADDCPDFGCLQEPREIRAALATLDPGDKERLRRQRERFAQLSTSEQQQLRRFHRQLMNRQDAGRLYQLLKRYQQWLASLPATERAEILSLDPNLRVEAIKAKLIEYDPASGNVVPLGSDDAPVFLRWLTDYVAQYETQLTRKLPEPMQKRLQEAPRLR